MTEMYTYCGRKLKNIGKFAVRELSVYML